MDNIKCISDVFGSVECEQIIKYVEKNWREIKYKQTIERLLKKFKESVQWESENSMRKKKYNRISERWNDFDATSEQYGTPISGHFDTCEGDSRCHCTRILFIIPREIICEIANAYYPVQCIVEQIRSYRPYKEVTSNLAKNWRRMDLKMVIKGLLEILHSVDSKVIDMLNLLYNVPKIKDPEIMPIDHCPYDCRFVFDAFGLYDCHCTIAAYRYGPLSFINRMVEEIYDKRNI